MSHAWESRNRGGGAASAKNQESRPGVSKLLLALATLFAFLIPFDFLPFLLGRSAAFPVGMLVVAAALTEYIYQVPKGRANPLPVWFLPVSCAMATWLTVTALWSASLSITMSALVSLYFHITMVVALRKPLSLFPSLLVRAYVHGTAVVSLLLLSGTSDVARGGRTSIGGADENAVALGVALGAAAALALAVYLSTGLRRVLGLVEFAVIALALVTIGSRTGSLSLVMMVVGLMTLTLVGLVRSGRFRPMLTAVGIVAATPVAYTLALERGLVPARVAEFLSNPVSSDEARDSIISTYLKVLDQWFLFGVGYGADAQFLLSTGLGHNNAHSLFWKNWIEGGLIGLIFLIVFLGLSLRRAFLAVDWQLPTIMWVAFLPFAISLGGERTDHFWLLVGLSIFLPPRREPSVPEGSTRGAPRSPEELV